MLNKLSLLALLLSPGACAQGQWTDTANFTCYEPRPGMSGSGMLLCFSPGGDAKTAATQWVSLAAKHRLILVGSKQFRNGPNDLPAISRAFQTEIVRAYSPDPTRSYCTGLSGGGQFSYSFVRANPRSFAGVIVNTGKINDSDRAGNWPRDKVAMLLASPGDFRYQEMTQDKTFLESKGWMVHWLEFKGGHTYAPVSALTQAVRSLGL